MTQEKTGIEATVIIPTFGRADFVIWSLKSAQQQTITEIEIFVIGDGASPETRDIVERETKRDSRVRFFDNPKGEGNGELHRHQAILQSQGRIICYLGHDDLWFPEHVESMLLLLRDADFGQSMHTWIARDGTISGFLPVISDPLCRSRMLRHTWNRFGPTCTAHTRDIYSKLPYGWRPAPLDVWSDLHMWRQFITHPGCRFAGLYKTTTIKLGRSERQDYSIDQYDSELAEWFPRLSFSKEAQRLSRAAIQNDTEGLKREIIHTAVANLRTLPANRAARSLALSLFYTALYIFPDRFIPVKLAAFKDHIIEQAITRTGFFNKPC